MPIIGARIFYDLPVYRLEEDRYYEQQRKYIDDVVFPPDSPFRDDLIARDKDDPHAFEGIKDHVWRSYGGAWQFNEIIGYVRLHFLGSQVRGEYHAVRKKRVVRTRRKQFEYLTWKLAPEVDIFEPTSNENIYSAILEYIDDCRKELKNRYIDTSIFEILGPCVDWKAVYDA